MRIVCLIALCCATCLPDAAFASDPDTGVIIKKVFDAASGEGKLLRLFRTRETVNVSSDIHRLSDWKEVDGVQYPAKCIGFKKNTEKPWYFSESSSLNGSTICLASRSLHGWFTYFRHCFWNIFEDYDKRIRLRLRRIMLKRNRTNRERLSRTQRWPNAYFSELGLFSLREAHAQFVQSTGTY